MYTSVLLNRNYPPINNFENNLNDVVKKQIKSVIFVRANFQDLI